MRVLVDGSDKSKVNKIVITTFLDGLYSEYKKNLCIGYTGKGFVSKTVEEWCDKTFPASGGRNSFNAEWLYKDFLSKENDLGIEAQSFGYFFVEDYKPDLIFLFNIPSVDYIRPARANGIPLYKVEKDIHE